MAAPAVKPRKVIKEHTNEAVQLEEVIETIGRVTGYGSFNTAKPPWQRDQLRIKSQSRNIPES